ncbi:MULTISPECIES: 5-oxoprolinase subunit B family protein [unclassified Nocardioides]|uniref:5-oxoprolinase subunit B family protein n=1 Tax=unclassified Nocardioides TaxID=2615069 RepID=UPI00070375ED|nr:MULTISPECIES: allophanate hydrolase subunit 1 [unclassified Nocardioides]KRC56810.1 allophanate hydrolase [Nocardioides sp. Root79]KRC77019.1 allophanate hydrolase [Nocardioides sp. Root240]
MNVLPYGDRGLLLELADTAAVVAAAGALLADSRVAALVADVVPGARTVLLVARPGVSLDRLRAVVPGQEHLNSADSRALDQGPPQAEVVIPVVYDGPDLAEVADRTGLTEAEVVDAHTGRSWQVAFGGFAPGFAYLVGGDPRLQVPRREQPRTTVPAGAVGLAGEFSGVYPRASPGGWQLIGHTDVALWDLERDPPALLAAGTTVRFVEA